MYRVNKSSLIHLFFFLFFLLFFNNIIDGDEKGWRNARILIPTAGFVRDRAGMSAKLKIEIFAKQMYTGNNPTTCSVTKN